MTDASRVTLRPKCYVYVCAGCGDLNDSERSDQVTCSPACRVRAHRNGSLKELRSFAKGFEIELSLLLQARAIQLLRPDLAAEVGAGRLTIDDAQPSVHRAFIALVFAENKPEAAQ